MGEAMKIRTIRLLLLAAVLVLLSAAGAAAQEIASGALTLSGDYVADFVEDRGQVTVLRLSGSYDRNLPGGLANVEPRTVLAQEFYKKHPDSYDFLVTFTTFPVSLGEAVGLHWSVRNGVQGIGIEQFDNSGGFGSDGRLQGYIDMGPLASHANDPFDPAFEETLNVLTHEILHQWAAHVRFQRPGEPESDGLLGRDGSHWSFLLDSGASVLYGNQWRDNGDGTFTTDGGMKFYSPLDLYLAGFLAADEVPPFVLIDSPGFDRNRLPERGVTVTGTPVQVTIEDVINAEGHRIPSASESQKEFRAAFLLVTRPDETVPQAQIEALDRIRRALVTRFAALTGGRGILHVYPEAVPGEETGAPDPVEGGGLRPGQANLSDALAWLRSRQGADGSWLDTAGTQARDSAIVLATLATFDSALEPGQRALAVSWLSGVVPPNTDAAARLATALQAAALAEPDPARKAAANAAAEAFRSRLRERQGTDGGWGLSTGYGSDPLDTALAVLALAGQPGTPSAALDRAGQYLLANRGADGAWSNVARGASRTGATVAALRALKALGRHAPVADGALTFLAARQNPDGGFGDSPSTAHDTANVLQTVVELGTADRIDLSAALGYLTSRQTVEGSWEGSTYTTAAVVSALRRQGTFPNWRFSTPPAAAPASPRDGERVTLTLTVANDGQAVTPASLLRLFDGDPSSGGTPVGDAQIPPIAPGRTVVLAPTWDSFGKPGEHTLWAVLDPDAQTAEMSELDNQASIRVAVQPAPAGAELEVRSVDVAILPAQPSTLPVLLGIAVSVRNLGQTAAAAVAVQLWHGPPETGELIDQVTVSVPSRSSSAANFLYDLTAAGTTAFTVVVDPGSAIAEADETNNTATATVTTQAAVDLEVTVADLALSGSAYLGVDATFEATFRNQGTVDSGDAVVRFSVVQGSTVRELGSRTIQLDAGQSLTQSVIWRVDLEGELQFVAEVDPGATVPEADETNNSASLAFTSGQVTQPNLVVSHADLAFSPKPGREGRPLTVTALVRNTGGQAVTNVEVAFYQGNPAQAAPRIGDIQVIPELAAGASATVSLTWPRVPDANDRVIHVAVDPDQETAEFSESDNVAFQVLEVLSLPDAALSSASLRLEPGVPAPGQPVTLIVTVSNLGEQESEGLVVRASDGGTPVGGDQVIPVLAGRGSAQASFTWTFAAGSEARPIVAVADPDGAVEEGSESNNSAGVEVSVQDGDFFATNRYFSPNGDGVKDTTRFFFRLGAPADVTVEVVSPKGEVVRRHTGPELAGIESGSYEWDGRDERGLLAPDGGYRLRAVGPGGAEFGVAVATLDTDRWPLLKAMGTPYASFQNLTCDLPRSFSEVVSSDDGQWLFLDRWTHGDPAYPPAIYRMNEAGGDLRPIAPSPDGGFAVSPDGSRIAFSDSTLWITNSDGSGLREIWDGDSYWHGFTPGGEAVVTITDERIVSVPLDGSAPRILFAINPANDYETIGDSYFSPDRRTVIFPLWTSYEAGEYRVLDVETGQVAALATFAESYWDHFAWSPDGTRVAVAEPRLGRILVRDTAGNLIRAFPIPAQSRSSVPEYEPEGPFTSGTPRVHYVFRPTWGDTGSELAALVAYEEDGERYANIMRFDLTTGEAEPVLWLEPSAGGNQSYHVSTWDGSSWVERGELHYGLAYQEQRLDLSRFLPDPAGEFKVRIRQTGLEAAHVDTVALVAGRRPLEPASAVRLGAGTDMRAALAGHDEEVVDLHEAEMEVRWADVPPNRRFFLSLTAREEGDLNARGARPFTYPAAEDGAYTHVLGGATALVADGEQTAADDLPGILFSEVTRPETGHPAEVVWGYVKSDGEHIYAALDFTVDNTLDGERDWGALQVAMPEGWKEFRVTASDDRWGKAGFIRTGKVGHTHKYYEFKVPLSEIEAAAGSTVKLRFQAYGTAALLDGEELLPWNTSGSPLYWAPFERTLVYNSRNEVWAIFLDEDKRLQRFPGGSFDPSYVTLPVVAPAFAPNGKRLFFTSDRDSDNPESPCFERASYSVFAFDSLLNLTASLRPRRSTAAGGILLEGSAADLNFARYTLEYASTAAPTVWRPIAPPSPTDLVDGRFGTWVPPAPGSYLVRLTAEDLAGNVRSRVKRVSWADTPALTDLYTEPAYISPNGDGVQDQMVLHYRVLEPVHLEISIFDEDGGRVRTMQRDHSLVGAEFEVSWDGRDGRGLPVSDGEYRITIESYEFFVVVDNTPPKVTAQALIKAGCGPQRAPFRLQTLAVAPMLSFGVKDVNFDGLSVETGEGASPSRWLPLFSSSVNSADQGYGMPVSAFVNHRFRVEGRDKAGNRALAATALGSESIFLRSFGPHRLLPDGKLAQLVSMCGAPLLFEKGAMRLAFTESVRAQTDSLTIQFQPVPATGPLNPNGWIDAPVQALGSKDGEVEAVWDLAGVLPGVPTAARLRLKDAAGGVHFSGPFTFEVDGVHLDRDPLSSALLERISEEEPALASSLARLLSRTGLDPDQDLVLWGRELITAPLHELKLVASSQQDPRYAVPKAVPVLAMESDGVFIVNPADWAACITYSARAVGITQVLPEPDPITGLDRRTSESDRRQYQLSCLQIDAKWDPVPVGECNAPRFSTRRTLRLTPKSLDGKGLQILTLSERAQGVLYSVNRPQNGTTYEFQIETLDYPEGRIDLKARVTNVDGKEETADVSLIVDHTPPQMAITYPIEGQRICGIQRNGRNVMDVLARIDDAGGAAMRLDLLNASGSERLETLAPNPPAGVLDVSDGIALERFQGNGWSYIKTQFSKGSERLIGTVAATYGGFIAHLEVVDNGGFRLCTDTSFYFDGFVEGTRATRNLGIFSPNGDGNLDEVTASFESTELTLVDVDVHPGKLDPKDPRECLKDGARVRSLVSGLTVPEGGSAAWDGRNDGGTRVADGLYAMVVSFRDACGNLEEERVCVEVDTTPPQLAIAYPRPGDPLPMVIEVMGSVNDRNLDLWFAEFGEGGDPDTWGSLGTGNRSRDTELLAAWNTFGLGGDYTLRLRARDSAANEAETRVQLLIAAPSDLISYLEAGPRPFSPNGDGRREQAAIRFGLVNPARVDLSILSTGGNVVRKILEDVPLPAGAALRTWDGLADNGAELADGLWRVELVARLASNPLVTQREEVSVLLDRTPPVLSLSRPSTAFVPGAGPIVGSIGDENLVEYVLSLTSTPDAPAWEEIARGSRNQNAANLGSLQGLEEGEYAVRLEADDEGEIHSGLVFRFTVDNTPPKVTLSVPAANAVLGKAGGPVPVAGEVEEDHLDAWRLEYGAGDSPSAWTSLATGAALPLPLPVHGWHLTSVADGLYTLRLVAVDKAGHTTEAKVKMTVDNTPPQVAITAPADNGFVTGPMAVTGTASDPHLLEYRLAVASGTSGSFSEVGGGSASVNTGELFQWLALPPDGAAVLRLLATDTAGNQAETTVSVTLDVLPPAAPQLTALLENRRDARLTWTANTEPDLAGYFVYRDGAKLNAQPLIATVYVDANLGEGSFVYTVRAVDRAGQESERSNSASVQVDATPPETALFRPAQNARVTGIVDVTGTAWSLSDFKEYRLYVGPGDGSAGRQLLRKSPVPVRGGDLSQWDTTALAEGAVYTLRLEAEDLSGNVAVQQVQVTVDNLPPAAPTGLAATPSGTTANVAWNANTEPDLRGYVLYRDGRIANSGGAPVIELDPFILVARTFADTGLPDGTLTYEVYAIDQAGNLSAPSAPAQVTLDNRAPSAQIVQPADGAEVEGNVYILATTPDTDVARVLFQWKRPADAAWTEVAAADTTAPWEVVWNTEGLAYGEYQLRAVATDQGDRTDPAPAAIAVVFTDLTKPPAVDLTARVDGGDVRLTWAAATPAEPDLAGYHVDRTDETGYTERLTAAPIAATTYVDAGLPDAVWHYAVIAVDTTGNESDPSEREAVVYTPVLEQPYTPTPDAATVLAGTGIGAADVTGTAVRGSGTAPLPAATADDKGRFSLAGLALEQGANTFTVRLRDAEGNLSKAASVRVVADTPPSAPTGLAAAQPSTYQVDLTWNPNLEADILGYRPLRDGEPLLAEAPMTDRSATSPTDSPENAVDGDPGTTWWAEPVYLPGARLEVSWPEPRIVTEARILWGSFQGQTYFASDFDVEAWDGQAWVPLAKVRGNGQAESTFRLAPSYRTDRLRLTMLAGPDNVEVAELAVLAQPYTASPAWTDTAPDGRHAYTVTAVDLSGFESAPSASIEVPVGDVTPPAPVILAGTVDGSRTTLTWTASAEAARFDLYRDGTRVVSVPAPGLTYSEVVANGVYHYVVMAVDAAGNAAAPSNEVELTVAVAPPPAPVGLTVTPVPAGGALNLAWTPSPGTQPVSWRILRGTAAGGPYQVLVTVPVTTTAYRNTGLTNGLTYWYVIAALDGAGNVSAFSNEASGVPSDDVAPGVPFLFYPTIPGVPFTTDQPKATVIGSAEAGIQVVLLRDGQPVATATALAADAASSFNSGGIELPMPSPDGRYLWYPFHNFGSQFLDLETGSSASDLPVGGPGRWFPDGRSIASADEYGTISTYRLADGEVRELAAIDTALVALPSPNGQRLAVVGTREGQSGLWLYDLGSSAWTRLVNASPDSFHTGAMSWSPDGSALAVLRTSPSYQVQVVDAATGAAVTVESQAGYSAPDWSPDSGELLATSVADGSEQVVRVLPDGSGRQPVTFGPGDHRSPQWSPDGGSVAWISDSGVFVQPADGGEARQVHTGSDGELEWTPTGHLFLRSSSVERIVLAGRVTFPGVDLEDGDNVLTAATRDGEGNQSAPSPAIVVTVLASRPDLSVSDTGMTVLPQVLVSGGTARATAVVRNVGVGASSSTELTFVVLTPDGPPVTVAEHVGIGAIAPGASLAVSAEFSLTGATGRYTLVAVVDPADTLDESDETNNLASKEFTVLADAAPALFAATDRPVYAVGEDVRISLEAVNGGQSFTGRLEIAIEDAAGFLVENLPGFDVTVPSGGSLLREAVWTPVDVLAGAYRVHARLGNVAEATAAFTLGSSAQVTAELAADRATYVIGSTARLTGNVAYRAGNEALTGVVALVQVLPEAGGSPVAEFTRTLGDLLPGAGGSVTADWLTTGAVAGGYRARIEVRQGERVLATAETRFDLAAQAPRVTGTLTLSSRTPAWGSPVTATLSVRLTGGAALSQVPVRVVVLEPAGNETLATQPFQLDLPASGAAVQRSAPFDAGALGLGGRLAMLEADVNGQTVTLDVESLTVLDLTPPTVAIVQPLANATTDPDVEVVVTARDSLSPLGQAEVSLDGGAWLRMSVRDAANGRFARSFADLAQGEHRLKARAFDAWGNVAETAEIAFTVSVAADPVLTAIKTDALAVDLDGDGIPEPGDTIEYTVVVGNTGSAPATDVVVVDPVPAHTAVVPGSVTTTAGTIENQDPPRVALGELAADAEETITFRVTVVSPLPAGVSQVVNQATVTSAELPAVLSDDPDLGGAANPTATAITAAPRLVAEKTDTLAIDADEDGQPSPGDTIEYTILVRNTGNSGATGVMLNDPVPTHTTLVSGSNQADLGTIAGGASATVAFRVRIDSTVPAGVHQISNQGTVTSNQLPAVLTNDPDATGPTVTPITAAPSLTVTKTDVLYQDADNDGTASPGDALLYQITVANGGNTSATRVELADAIPAHTAIEAGSVQTSQGSITSEEPVAIEIGEIVAGANATVSFRVRIDSTVPAGVREVSNQASLASAELPAALSDDPDAGGDADATVTPIAAAPRLRAEKTDALAVDANGDGVPSPGDTVEYTIVLRNTGNTPATGVEIHDPVPTRTDVVAGSASTTLGTIEAESPLHVAVGELAAAGQATVVFRARIDAVVPAGVRQVSNQATILSSELPAVLSDDPGAGGAADPTVTPIQTDPLLNAEKIDALAIDADGDGSPSPGDTLEYTVTVRNTGSGPATDVLVVDPVPAHTTVVPGSVETTAGTVESQDPPRVALGELAAGTEATIAFRVTVASPLPAGVSQVVNQATVTSDELPAVLSDDPDLGGAADPTATAITASPRLVAEKTDAIAVDADGDGQPSPGDTIEYTILVRNTGNSEATGVTLDDPMPAHTTLVSGSNQANLGSIQGGTDATVTFQVRIDSTMPAGVHQISNQGTVTSNQLTAVLTDDPDAAGAADPTVTPITAAPSLTVTKTDVLFEDADDDGAASPGDTLLYQIAVANGGNTSATGVELSDAIPANTAIVEGSVQVQGTVVSESPVQVEIGEIAAGSSATVSFRVRLDSTVPAGVLAVSNQAAVTSSELPAILSDDPDAGGDTDPTVTPIAAAPRLSAEKTDALVLDADGDGSPSPGDTIEYSVVLRNTGNTPATGILLHDPVPTRTSAVAGSISTTLGTMESESPLRVSMAELAAGGEATVVFRVRIDATVPAGTLEVSNQASIMSNELPAVLSDDPDAGGAADPTVTAITAAPRLVAEKTALLAVDADGDGFPSPGDTLEYSLAIRNLGNTGATGVALADAIPALTTVVPGSVIASAGSVESESPVEVSIGTLDAGATASVSFRVTVSNPFPGALRTVVNQGTVTSAELPDVLTDDPAVAGTADPTVTAVTAAPRLAVIKTDVLFEDADGEGAASPNDALLYQITVTNSGNTTATGLLLEDPIPADTAIVLDTVQASQGMVLNESPVVVDLGDVAAGASATVSFRVRIASPIAPDVTAVSNQATVTNVELPPVLSDDPDTPQAGDPTATPIVITPAIAIGGAAVDEDAGTAELAVTLSVPSNQAIEVEYGTADGTATSGVDYTSAAGTLAFAPGETAKTVTVAILDDTLDEDDETFTVTLSGVQGTAILAVAEGLGTIRDDDDPPGLIIGDVVVPEGNGPAFAPVTLSTATSRNVRVSWATAAVTAQPGADYVESTGTVIIPAGSLADTISLEILPDLLDEADETFRVSLSSPVGAAIIDHEATVTVADDDALPSLSVADVTVAEGTGSQTSAVFAVTLSAASGRAVSVHYATQPGTAQADLDYLPPVPGTLTFPAGTTSLTVTVPVVGDGLPEGTETFSLALSLAENAALADAVAIATVEDDDGTPVLSIAGTSVQEGDSGTVSAELTLSLNAVSGSAVTVQYATESGTANEDDYVPSAGTATIPAGSLSTTVTVQVDGDEENETDETFLVRLSGPVGATLGNVEGTVTILDDDLPRISVLDLRVTEGNAGTANALVQVELDAPSAVEVRVAYATEDGTAKDGRDYQAVSGILTFTPGQTARTIAVPVIGDTKLEDLEETFEVVLAAPVEAEIERGRAEVVIEDNEACLGPNLLVNPGAEEPSAANDSIPGWTETGSGWQRRTANPAPAEGTAYFFAGNVQHAQLTQDVNVLPYGLHILLGGQEFEIQASVRTLAENPSDTARVALEFRDLTRLLVLDSWDSGEIASPGAWQTLTHRRRAPLGTGWIRVRLIGDRFNGGSNDGYFDAVSLRPVRAATLSIGDALVYEGPVGTTTNAVFPLTLSCPMESEVSVRYATTNGTALAGSDYLASQGVVTFPSGVVSRTVTVPVLGDDQHELHENFIVHLTEPAPPNPPLGLVLLHQHAVGAIVNDDFCPRSPGFWKNHLLVWPASSLTLGNIQYNTLQLLGLLNYKGSNTSNHLARQLVATRFNLLVGSPASIVPTVNAADLFLAAWPPGSNPPSAQKQAGEVLKNQLDAYNNMGCQEDQVIP